MSILVNTVKFIIMTDNSIAILSIINIIISTRTTDTNELLLLSLSLCE